MTLRFCVQTSESSEPAATTITYVLCIYYKTNMIYYQCTIHIVPMYYGCIINVLWIYYGSVIYYKCSMRKL